MPSYTIYDKNKDYPFKRYPSNNYNIKLSNDSNLIENNSNL